MLSENYFNEVVDAVKLPTVSIVKNINTLKMGIVAAD